MIEPGPRARREPNGSHARGLALAALLGAVLIVVAVLTFYAVR